MVIRLDMYATMRGKRMTHQEAIELLKDHEYWTDFSWMDEVAEMAIEALEKQIPIKPIYTNNGTVTRCKCGAIHFQSIPNIKLDYCSRCGQAIDWSEEVGE